MKRLPVLFSLSLLMVSFVMPARAQNRLRARQLGIKVGILHPGPGNSITDVKGVRVGQVTLSRGRDIRTGVTAVVPHSGNVFLEKVPAAVYVGNGFGKLMGISQIDELGNLETPVLLTSTLNVPRVADALLDHMLQLPGMGDVRSVNPVVGETNDGYLNDIRSRPVGRKEVFEALEKASSEPVQEGCVGAGTGTVCYGFKGGIGSSSRQLPKNLGGFTVGVLVQTNFGGILQIAGAPVGIELERYYLKNAVSSRSDASADGSCMIVVATDAPLTSRNLKRLARRAMLGVGATGSPSTNGSGDYVIAFSTAPGLRIPYRLPRNKGAERLLSRRVLANQDVSPLFEAVKEATEEAIYNSLFMAHTTRGFQGHEVEALPIEKVIPILKKYHVIAADQVIPDRKQ